MNLRIVTIAIIIFSGTAFSQPELDIKPNKIEFKDLFNRFDKTYLVNKGNELLTIDSLSFKESFYIIDFEDNLQLPFTIVPDDSIEMDVTLSGFYHITVSDTSDTIYVYNGGINSPEPLRVKIDFFEDEFGDFTGTVTDSITLLENANVYFFYNGIYLLDTATTDVNGNYSATLPEGDYTIATEMRGYYVQFHDSTYDPYFAKIEELDSGEVKTINFNMLEIEDTNFSVSGSIFDSLNGTPMDKGIIIVRKGTHVPTMKPSASFLLDTLNAFAGLIRPNGSFKVFVQQQDYYYLQAYTNYFLPGYYNDEGIASVYWQNADSLLINNVII
ncbi:MAG: carboxypeptidase regulatory-like domain-containing protein, partial [Cyclobacteriaceae bacterium]|nr:carboxypeptidase regulatory-like domain-containing protein [Cyclobacteriaceae bacterium]